MGSSVKILRFVVSRSLLDGILMIKRIDLCVSSGGSEGAREIVTDEEGFAEERVTLVDFVSLLASAS